MGQQIQIAATPADEEKFLAFLRDSADVQLFVPCAPTVEELWVNGFAPYGPYHTQYWVWNKAYAWTPKYGYVNEEVKGHGGWPYVSNNLEGPVIEFSRTDLEQFRLSDLAFGHGRIYWAKYDRQIGFEKWFGAILRWIRRTGTNISPNSRNAVYCLPDALEQWTSRSTAC
jgi:hypothetical protein